MHTRYHIRWPRRTGGLSHRLMALFVLAFCLCVVEVPARVPMGSMGSARGATAWAADDTAREFSVLAVGNYTVLTDLTFEDANEFNSCFGGAGPAGLAWSRIQYERDSNVQYWDFYDYSGDPEADQGDILYFMGHGYSSTTWNGQTILSPLALQVFKDTRYSTSDPRGYCNPTRIGINSASKWNDDLDWAIFAACSTLANDGSAGRWAGALHNGMRTLLGYRQLSHGYPDDRRIIENWEDRVRGIGYTPQCMIQAWYNAHAHNPYYLKDTDNWAAVGHDKNFYDHLWGIKTGNTADVRGSTSDVRYYDHTNYSTHGVTPRHTTSRIVAGRTAPTTLSTPVPRSPSSASIIRGLAGQADLARVCRSALGHAATRTRASGRLGAHTAFRSGSRALVVDGSGAQTVEGTLSNAPCSLTRERAVRLARDWIERVWSMPADAELRHVGAIRSVAMFDKASRPVVEATPTVLAYSVEFGRRIGSTPVVGCERISVDVQDEGAIAAYWSWHDLGAATPAASPISAHEAVSVFARNVDKVLPIAGQALEICEVSFAYLSAPSSTRGTVSLRPVWRVGFQVAGTEDHASPTHVDVDALTGVLMP